MKKQIYLKQLQTMHDLKLTLEKLYEKQRIKKLNNYLMNGLCTCCYFHCGYVADDTKDTLDRMGREC